MVARDEVAAIGEHEHIPDIAATALANYLITHPHGGEKIRCMIVDDIHKALDDGRVRHASELFMALRHLLDACPVRRAQHQLAETPHTPRLPGCVEGKRES